MDLQVALRDPMHIFLSTATRHSLICENVESSSSVHSVMQLLQDRGLVSTIPEDYSVVAKKQDGTTMHVKIGRADTLQDCKMRMAKNIVRFTKIQAGMCLVTSQVPLCSSTCQLCRTSNCGACQLSLLHMKWVFYACTFVVLLNSQVGMLN